MSTNTEKILDQLTQLDQAYRSTTDDLKDRIGILESKGSIPIFNGKRVTAAKMEADEYLMDVIQRKAVTVGTASEGGNAAPEFLSEQIQAQIRRLSPLTDLVRVEKSSTGQYAKLVTDLTHGSGWVGEGDTRSETGTATFFKIEPTFGMVYAYPKASEESFDDIFFDVSGWFVEESSKGFAKQLGEAIVNGNGTSKPTGFLQASTSSTPDFGESPGRAFGTVEYEPTGAAAGFQQDRLGSPQGNPGDVLYNAFFALNEFHRQEAVWIMNSATFREVRKFKDADGNYLWERNFGDTPASLLGRPVRIIEGMPDIAANAYPVAVADWKAAYVLVPVGDLRVTWDEVTTPGQVKLYARQRYGGKLLDSAALKLVKCATS